MKQDRFFQHPCELNNNITKFIWHYYRKYPGLLFLFVICSIYIGLHGFLISLLIKYLIISLEDNNSNLFAITGVSLIVVFELHNNAWRTISYVNLKTSPFIKKEIIKDAYSYIQELPIYFFQAHNSGQIASSLSQLADCIDRLVTKVGLRLLRGTIQIISAIISLYLINLYLSVGLALWASVFISLSIYYSRRIITLSSAVATNKAKVLGTLVDSVANYYLVRVQAAQENEKNYIQNKLNDYTRTFQSQEKFRIKLHLLQGTSITLLVSFVILILYYAAQSNSISTGDFAFILTLLFFLTENIWNFAEQFDDINDSYGTAKYVIDKIYIPVHTQPSKNININLSNSTIFFKDVSFSYPEKPPLFTKKNITIYPNQKIGLVGDTGSGKSTFINLLLGVYTPDEGDVYIGEYSIQDIQKKCFYQQISLIPQDTQLFNRTIWENIAFGAPNATMGQIVDAARKAQIHNTIDALKNGYNTVIGERGVNFSGGERQRIAIARAILKNAKLVILDEATSDLDPITEKTICKAFDQHLKDVTTIIIAHRLETVKHLDLILFFRKGRIIAKGTHNQLIESCSEYQEFCLGII